MTIEGGTTIVLVYVLVSTGVIIAFAIAVLMNVGSYWFSDKLVLRMYNAQEVGPDHPLTRIVARLEFIPDARVAELFGACDAAVFPRSDGGTSGALILAMSLAVPAIAARTPVYEELLEEGKAGWLFEPGDPAALHAALEDAVRDPEAARAKGAAALAGAQRLHWPAIARRTAELFEGLRDSKRA